MPAEQGVRGDDRGDPTQYLTADPEGAHREPPPVRIGQAQPLPAQLLPKEPGFLDQIRDRLPLPAIQSAGQDQQQ